MEGRKVFSFHRPAHVIKEPVFGLHAVIANLCSEHEDTGEELTVEMEEAMDVSDPDNLSASEDLHTYINEQRPIVREALRRFRQNSQ